MTREAFRGWGSGLSDDDFGRAIATLGVLAPELAGQWIPRGKSRTPPKTATRKQDPGVQKVSETLRDLTTAARNADRELRWIPSSLSALRASAAGCGIAPALLASMWSETGAGTLRLQIRPIRGLDRAWTYSTLAAATPFGTPYIPIPDPPGRLRWTWPMQVGFLVGHDETRGEIYGAGETDVPAGMTVGNLTEPVTGPNRTDVLVLPARPFLGAGWPPLSLPQATLVLLFSQDPTAIPFDRMREITRRSAAWGAVEVATQNRVAWFRTFVRTLSHDEGLVEALVEALRFGDVRMFIAGRSLAGCRPLRVASNGFAARLEAAGTIAVEEINLPRSTLDRIGIKAFEPPTIALLGERLLDSQLEFTRESDGATDIADAVRAARPVTERIEAEVIERFLRTDVYVRERRRYRPLAGTLEPFRAGVLHRIDVSIGPADRRLGRLVADIPLRHEDLQAAVGHRLTIVFTEPAILEQPVVRKLELPPVGSTRMARFALPIPSSARRVRARIVVLHRGRILQTAVLEGPTTADPAVVRRIRAAADRTERRASRTVSSPVLRVEADLRPRMGALDGRRRYHAAIVLNHASDGTPGGTTVVGNTAKAITYPDVVGAVESISETLSRAEKDHAFNRKLDSDASLKHLRQLAIDGHIIYEDIGEQIEKAFGGPIEYLQILSTDPKTLLPVEICYDLPAPAPTATLCKNWKTALATGACDLPHTPGPLGLAAVVCPSGFWGLTKVIERQATRDFTSDKPFWVDIVPKEGRQTLRKVSTVLWAGSDKVDAVEPGELKRLAGELGKLTNHHAARVFTWPDWGKQVKHHPPLLLLLSHTETKVVKNALEIAAAERLALGQIEYQAVIGMPAPKADTIGPIVLLLGCTTALPLKDFQSYLVRFAKKGAPIVVATIAPVLGRHASRTAEALIGELIRLQAKQHGGDAGLPFGEALRTMRRAMMADGRLMAMSLASYGDADWRLSPGE